MYCKTCYKTSNLTKRSGVTWRQGEQHGIGQRREMRRLPAVMGTVR